MAKKYHWTSDELALLGTMADSSVAKRLGLSKFAVWKTRRKLGIDAIPGSISRTTNWTAEILSMLGAVPDSEVARVLGVSISTVQIKRCELGITTFRESIKKSIWTAEVIAQLGKISDRELARRLKVTSRTIRLKRQELGIQNGRPSSAWPPQEIALLGTASDKEVAEMIGRAPHVVRSARRYRQIPAFKPVKWTRSLIRQLTKKKRDIPEWCAPIINKLGAQVDSKIAKEVGVHCSTVAKLRKRLKVPAKQQQGRAWLPEEVAMLGKFSDAEVARRTGRNKSGVKMERTNRRIPGVDPAEAGRQYRLQRQQEK